MGCGQSKIEHEEGVTRCKDRKEFMKKAVASRNAFAAAHSAYAVSLRNTGAALNDYGQGEVNLVIFSPSSSSLSNNNRTPPSVNQSSSSSSIPSSSAAPVIIQTPIDNPLPPPPPPLPDFPPPPLQRAVSMPDLQLPKKLPKPPIDDSIREEEDGDADDEDETDDASAKEQVPYSSPPKRTVKAQVESSNPRKPATAATGKWLGDYIFDTENMPVPSLIQPEIQQPVEAVAQEPLQEKVVAEPVPPPAAAPAVAPQKEQKEKQVKKQKAVQYQHSTSVGGAVESKRGKGQSGMSVNLLDVLNQLDDHFLRAYESAHEVSKMLEATRMHYHSNFADNRGHIDHSARVMRVITWNRSCKALKDENDLADDFDKEEETHATILDKMLAWEKKLFEEVKAGEVMKIEYQRKVASLHRQKKRNASPETLEKTKAAVSHLHTRYIVDMQSMDSTVSEINRLRDKQLYPKLKDIVDGMATMWETMYKHHSSQYKIAGTLRNLDISLAPKETTEQHYKRTKLLADVLSEWHDRFQSLIKYQKEHIQAMNNWLKLNLIPIESNIKEKVSSPPKQTHPPIQPLLHAWHDLLEKLPEDRARGVIHTFKEVMNTIKVIQEDELKLKDKCENTRREFVKRQRAFEDWHHKYSEKKAAMAAEAAEASNENDGDVAERDEILLEKKVQLESLIARLKEEEDMYHRTCKQVREKSIGSLKIHLPELFRALSDFAHECSEMFMRLRLITRNESEEAVEVS